ncbi:penicillin-insensitive murein endopeptidase [Magnetospirillum sp. SS-4]|uniref:penicillin-insensitive murein endopeptidase n=1 Tax=Magnetospirillum sp. SS-4 TaxID=2681465 RepID=UPI0020C483DA|nr:penicillin-insensitive murein endopeptidase [Magnetospirillum sp. SS-4]
MAAALVLLSAIPGPVLAQPQDGWSSVRRPLAGAPAVIGSAAAGCVQGAQALRLEGENHQALRPARHRYWGHPATVAFVEDLARTAAAEGIGRLLIGDMAQPRGGPMSFGHASHQNGLDVDIWFRLSPERLGADELNSPRPARMVAADRLGVSAEWMPAQARLLELAARSGRVERIFVNPVIKQALCRSHPADDRGWLGKLRPWWGHDEHFHVRLACPADSPDCEPQKPFPEGDGCGEELSSWLVRPTSPAPPDKAHVQSRRLPEACRGIPAR